MTAVLVWAALAVAASATAGRAFRRAWVATDPHRIAAAIDADRETRDALDVEMDCDGDLRAILRGIERGGPR